MLKSIRFNHTNLLHRPESIIYDYFDISLEDPKSDIIELLFSYLSGKEKTSEDSTVIFYVFMDESKYNRAGYWMVSVQCTYDSSLKIFQTKKWGLDVRHAIDVFLNDFFDLYIIQSKLYSEDLLDDFGITPESVSSQEEVQEMTLSNKGMVEVKLRRRVEGEIVDDSKKEQSRTSKLRASIQQRKGIDSSN